MIIFRCNAGPQIGFGHLVRCRALAQALKEQGEESVMIGPDPACRCKDDFHIFSEWIPRSTWKTAGEDANWLAGLAKQKYARMLVIDDYRADAGYQLVLKNAGLRWLQFSQPNQNLWADFIVNTSPDANAQEYQPYLRNPNAKLLLGPKYAILRPEFKQARQRPVRKEVKRILVIFGGGDDRGATRFVLETLLPNTPEETKFLVISGKHNPRNKELLNWIDSCGNNRIDLKIDPSTMAPLFAQCDLAIMGGGTTTYEGASCGLPMILIAIANNQVRHSKAWEKIGIAFYIGTLGEAKKKYPNKIVQYLNLDKKNRSEIARNAMLIVDGQGAEKISKLLLKSL
ncbi:MAG: UDP-2,4-diacetamido-2,4,6-trideoxy-beta-L-altropyranose hydrolase [Desulfobacterales bacterium]